MDWEEAIKGIVIPGACGIVGAFIGMAMARLIGIL